MKVGDRMSRNVVTLEETDSLREAIGVLRKHKIRHAPVVQEGRVVGIVTDRDLKRATPSLLTGIDQDHFDRILEETMVEHVMTRNPSTVAPSMSLKEAATILLDNRFGSLPVLEGDRLVGILTTTDLLRALHEMLA